MKKITSICILFLLTNIYAEDMNGKAQIKQIIAQINKAWKSDNGIEIMKNVISEKSFTYAMPEVKDRSRALIFNKKQFMELFKKMIKKNRPIKHHHTIKKITIIGPMAYVVGVVDHISKDKKNKRKDEIMNIFAKDETGWKLIFSTPFENITKSL